MTELNGMTIAELKEFAEERGIDLGGATRKADILNTIEAALESGETEETEISTETASEIEGDESTQTEGESPAEDVYERPSGISADSDEYELIIKAAQLDPGRRRLGTTPGSEEAVEKVQRALVAKGLLTDRDVNGSFEWTTKVAFQKFQRSHNRLGTSGIPTHESLDVLFS